jgi:hypothetical protein
MASKIIRRRAAASSILALATLCGALALLRASSLRNNNKQTIIKEHHNAAVADGSFSSSSTITTSFSRRQLSEALPNGGCKLTWPKKPAPGTPITYAASYPGCGARMTWNLVEALTGLETGDDWNNNGRGSEVVTVKTHYPQSNGILPEFDDRIHRAFIVIRNPLESIPSVSLYFDCSKNN